MGCAVHGLYKLSCVAAVVHTVRLLQTETDKKTDQTTRQRGPPTESGHKSQSGLDTKTD
jgi:hypothetical protein